MRGLCTFSLVLLLVVSPGLASAQDGSDTDTRVNLTHARFDATGTGFSVLSSPRTLRLFQGAGGFTMHLSDEPFILYEGVGDSRVRLGGVIQSQLMVQLHGAIGFGFIDVGLILPVAPVVVWGGDPTDGTFPIQVGDVGGVGDLTVVPKVRLLDPSKKGFGFGVQLPISFPTGHAKRYLGDGGMNFAVSLLAELQKGPVRALFNFAPVHVRPKFEYADLVRHVGMDWAAGISVNFTESVAARVESWGTYSYQGGPADRFTGEWSASLVLKPTEHVAFTLGGGGGIAGFAVPKLRAFAGVQFTSPERGDKDADGILDSQDACPDAAEDFDSWDDADGCPDPDNDGDGIPDGDDACPQNAENPGVGDDSDGCPDVIEEPVVTPEPAPVDSGAEEPEDDGWEPEDGGPAEGPETPEAEPEDSSPPSE